MWGLASPVCTCFSGCGPCCPSPCRILEASPVVCFSRSSLGVCRYWLIIPLTHDYLPVSRLPLWLEKDTQKRCYVFPLTVRLLKRYLLKLGISRRTLLLEVRNGRSLVRAGGKLVWKRLHMFLTTYQTTLQERLALRQRLASDGRNHTSSSRLGMQGSCPLLKPKPIHLQSDISGPVLGTVAFRAYIFPNGIRGRIGRGLEVETSSVSIQGTESERSQSLRWPGIRLILLQLFLHTLLHLRKRMRERKSSLLCQWGIFSPSDKCSFPTKRATWGDPQKRMKPQNVPKLCTYSLCSLGTSPQGWQCPGRPALQGGSFLGRRNCRTSRVRRGF